MDKTTMTAPTPTPPVVEEMPDWVKARVETSRDAIDKMRANGYPDSTRPKGAWEVIDWLATALQSSQQRAEQQVLHEREACAQIAEGLINPDAYADPLYKVGANARSNIIAGLIRARSTPRTET